MLPKWFDTWNNANPTDVFKPAILVGSVGGAVFVAAMLVSFGQPFATTSIQTGPPGIGMVVSAFPGDLLDTSVEEYYTEPPYPPEEGEPLAGRSTRTSRSWPTCPKATSCG